MDPSFLSATEIATSIRSGERTAEDVAAQVLARIETIDGKLGAFCSMFAERAQQQARELDQRRANGQPLGPLAGVPIASKDNLLVAGQPATAGSRMLETFEAPFTATSLQRLVDQDAVLIGRTNMDEFGMGSTTETSSCQTTRNPHALDRVPGGSSGGSAAAVAAGLCPIAIGSDTGGSVRQPAALCGVTGLKPTYGRVPRYGLIAYASSLDCVGAIARSAEDLALWLDAASGHDPADATSLTTAAPVGDALFRRQDLTGLRLGIPSELNRGGIDDEVAAVIEAATDELRRLGAEIVTSQVPTAQHAVATYYLIASTQAASNLARYDGVHYGWRSERESAPGASRQSCIEMTTDTRTEGFGSEAQLRILLGTFASSVGYSDQFYGRARQAQRAIRRDFLAAFADCDAMLCPTSPTPAGPFGERDLDPLTRFQKDALTVPASLAGIPALSMPCGHTSQGLPIGMQLMAPHLREDVLLQVAHVFQQHTAHHKQRPQL